MGAAHLPNNLRGRVAIEVLKCATLLDGLNVVTIKERTTMHDVHLFGINPLWTMILHTWGEARVVKSGKDGKTGNHGKAMMFIGYPPKRESNSVKMCNPSTNWFMVTCDIIWLKRMYYEKENETIIKLDPFGMTEDAKEDTPACNDANNDDNDDHDLLEEFALLMNSTMMTHEHLLHGRISNHLPQSLCVVRLANLWKGILKS